MKYKKQQQKNNKNENLWSICFNFPLTKQSNQCDVFVDFNNWPPTSTSILIGLGYRGTTDSAYAHIHIYAHIYIYMHIYTYICIYMTAPSTSSDSKSSCAYLIGCRVQFFTSIFPFFPYIFSFLFDKTYQSALVNCNGTTR